MEDYKKKYEQALGKAKTLHKLAVETSHENTRMAIEELFPELCYSEDEKIRKNIISWLKNIEGQTIPINDYNSAIAWLERQGEQKPNFCHHEVDFSDCSEEYRKAYYDGWNNCNQQHAQLEAEQKPTWSENAKRMFIKALERVEEQNNKGYKLTDCDKNSWWEDFKAYSGYTEMQKPVWSEEDEENFNTLSKIICDSQASAKIANKLSDWLKSLKERMKGE